MALFGDCNLEQVRKIRLKPIYNGVKLREEVEELEAKVKILENHLYLPMRMAVAVSKENNYVVMEAKNWEDIIFHNEGNDGTKRSLIVRPYISEATLRIAVTLDEHRYDLRSKNSIHPVSNPFA